MLQPHLPRSIMSIPALPVPPGHRDTPDMEAPANDRRPTGPVSSLSPRSRTRTLAFIECHLGDPFTLEQLSRAACVSRTHFARGFRATFGMPPMAYVMRLRIECAKRMLLEEPVKVCDVSSALGFCDQSHFSRTFRRETGLAPRDYVHQQRRRGT